VQSGGEGANHPDLLVLDPVLDEEEHITIARSAQRSGTGEDEPPERCLEAFLALRPMEGGLRPVLMREAQRMNAAAQNALLKTLEEPRPATVLVLETHRSSMLLPTLLSRCVRIRFDSLSRADCERVLVSLGLAEDAARELARMSGGSPGLAVTMAKTSLRELRERLVGVASGERPALEVAREIWELEGDFPGNTPNARERERARAVVDLALGLVLDARRARAGVEAEDLAHGAVIPAVARHLSEAELARRCEALMAARADVERNLTPVALVERALLTLGEGLAAASRG